MSYCGICGNELKTASNKREANRICLSCYQTRAMNKNDCDLYDIDYSGATEYIHKRVKCFSLDELDLSCLGKSLTNLDIIQMHKLKSDTEIERLTFIVSLIIHNKLNHYKVMKNKFVKSYVEFGMTTFESLQELSDYVISL